MRIRETEEVEKALSCKEASVYAIADCDNIYGNIKNLSDMQAENDGYIKETLREFSVYSFKAKFRVIEEREITPDEELAWHILKAKQICELKDGCNTDCPLYCRVCMDDISVIGCKKLMEGKEVIE